MALSDIFTGAPTVQASQDQRNALLGIMGQTGQLYNTAQTGGLGALTSGQAGGLAALGSGYNAATGAITAAAPQALNFLQGYTGQGADALTAGQTGALGAIGGGTNTAIGAYAPVSATGARYVGMGTGAGSLYADALGLNGPEGIARAQSAFTASPGYQFSLNQGLDAINRSANATGTAAGGNTLRASGEYATNAANQEYQNYLANLNKQAGLYSPLGLQGLTAGAQGVGNAALTGGTAAGNVYTGTAGNLANLFSGTGQQGAGILTGQGTSLANLATGYGGAQAGIYGTTAQQEADLLSKLAVNQGSNLTTLAPGYGNTYQTAANAEVGGSQNLWNLIGGGVQLAAGGGFLPTGGGTAFGPYAPKKA